MRAVVEIGGKQSLLAVGDEVYVEKIAVPADGVVVFDDVRMLIRPESEPLIGMPTVPGARVKATVVSHGKEDSLRSFKMRRRKNSRRTIGHRQPNTLVRVSDIEVPAA